MPGVKVEEDGLHFQRHGVRDQPTAGAQPLHGLGGFGVEARGLALDGAGKADIVLRQARLVRRQLTCLTEMAGAQQGGFLVHDIDQGSKGLFGVIAQLFCRQGIKGGKAGGCGHFPYTPALGTLLL